MVGWRRVILLFICNLLAGELFAQEYRRDFIYNGPEEPEKIHIIEVDTTLFRMPITHTVDFYSDATRYYSSPVATRRRGLYYTTAESLVSPSRQYIYDLSQPTDQSAVTLYTAQSNYRVGVRATHSEMTQSDWSLSSTLWAQSGRDLFVEGVFRNTFSPQVTLSREFNARHFLVIEASLYYSMRGMQYGSTSEAYSLVGSNYYNPSWGFYDGKVRNSRVRRNFNPSLSLHDQREIGERTTLALEADMSYSRNANSSLGWYDASTPMPDYYRNMPSFLSDGEAKDYVTNIWRTNNQDYTQINWEWIETLNSMSSDGNAYYVLEDRVEQRTELRTAAVARTYLNRFEISYGLEAEMQSSRNFKKMRDLLGADYLVDYDVFMDDSYNSTMPLQNDLNNPDRKVVEGDRFGYDYTIFHSNIDAILKAQYRANRFDFDVEATVSGESYQRKGHYEKERFAGSSSFGESAIVSLSPYTLRVSMGYAYRANQYYAIKLLSSRLSPSEQTLFLNAAVANFLAPTISGERINSAAFAFRYNGYSVSLMGEIYALRSRDGSSIYSLYDDLMGSMCRAVITEIGYSSYGIELNADFDLHYHWRLSATLAAGRYYYDSDPYVELYDDYDLSILSDKVSSRMSGVNIGNAPQIVATTSATYFGLRRYILSASTSLSSRRYEQPSIVRRSERLLEQAFVSEESASAALEQQNLGDVVDVEIAASRYFWSESGGQFSVRLSVSNLLGQLSRVSYARESDRIILQSVDGYFSGSTLREGILQYGAPRTFKLSVGYKF